MSRRWIVLWMLTLWISLPAFAQSTGQLRVVVVDADQALPIPGVGLRLTSDSLPATGMEQVTDADGEALFRELPPGRYQLDAVKDGFSAMTAAGIRIEAGPTPALLEIELPSPAAVEQVVVSSKRSILTKEFLQKIPGGRAYQSGVSTTPERPVDAVVVPLRARAPEEPPAAPITTHAAMPPLRAGFTDDNGDFGAFLDTLATWDGIEGWVPIDVSNRRFVDVLDPDGRPVVGAEVQLVDRHSAVLAAATTQGDGRVMVFPDPGRPCDVFVDGVRREIGWKGDDDLEVHVDIEGGPVARPPVDVVLILDTTSSMSDELARVQATMERVLARLGELQASDLRLAAVRYRDTGDDYETRVTPFTRDTAAFSRMLRQTTAGGGGDTPESLNQALAEAMDLDYRPQAAKVAFVIADAPPHMDHRDTVLYDESLVEAAALGLKIHTVAASGLEPVGSLVFRQIAQYTRGRFIFIEYGGDVSASAASHGVASQVESNNLDAILFDRIRHEVEAYGR